MENLLTINLYDMERHTLKSIYGCYASKYDNMARVLNSEEMDKDKYIHYLRCQMNEIQEVFFEKYGKYLD